MQSSKWQGVSTENAVARGLSSRLGGESSRPRAAGRSGGGMRSMTRVRASVTSQASARPPVAPRAARARCHNVTYTFLQGLFPPPLVGGSSASGRAKRIGEVLS